MKIVFLMVIVDIVRRWRSDGMTNEEVLYWLKHIRDTIMRMHSPMARSGKTYNLKRAIALNIAIEALEKQIPKDPLMYGTEDAMMYALPWGDWGYECPCCGNRDIYYGYMFCECGQALKWEE